MFGRMGAAEFSSSGLTQLIGKDTIHRLSAAIQDEQLDCLKPIDMIEFEKCVGTSGWLYSPSTARKNLIYEQLIKKGGIYD